MHFKHSTELRTQYRFMLNGEQIEYADTYRYLGLDINETLDYTHCANILAGAGGRLRRSAR